MPASLDADLARLIEPGEVVLWSGRPHYPNFRLEVWAAFALGLIPLAGAAGFLLILMSLARDIVARGQYQNLVGLPILLVPTSLFGYVAAKALSAPWAARRHLRQAVYAVTDRRVIVSGCHSYSRGWLLPRPHNDLYELSPEQARARTVRTWWSGRVDLVLLAEVHWGTRGHRWTVEVGILGAEDWPGAEAAMDAAFGPDHGQPG